MQRTFLCRVWPADSCSLAKCMVIPADFCCIQLVCFSPHGNFLQHVGRHILVGQFLNTQYYISDIIGTVPKNMTIQILLSQFLKIWQSKYYWVRSSKYKNPNIIIIIGAVPQNMTIQILLGKFLKIWQSMDIIGAVPKDMTIQILLGQFLRTCHCK